MWNIEISGEPIILDDDSVLNSNMCQGKIIVTHMIIYTGRFQPFHNGHLSLIKTLRSSFPTEIICIAVIKDVPLQNKKDEFDELVDQQLRVSKNPFSSDVVLKLIDEVLQQEKLYNVVTTLMPRASKETWQIINALFDCKRIWAFTHNSLQPDEWEEEKAEFYSSMGESIIRIPIKKEIKELIFELQ